MTNAVFETASLAGIQLKNRIIRSATHEGMADEKGFPTEKLKNLYIRLAKGEVGAIITGYAGIQADGKSSLFAMLMIDNDDCVRAYQEITNAVHNYGTAIIMQLREVEINKNMPTSEFRWFMVDGSKYQIEKLAKKSLASFISQLTLSDCLCQTTLTEFTPSL